MTVLTEATAQEINDELASRAIDITAGSQEKVAEIAEFVARGYVTAELADGEDAPEAAPLENIASTGITIAADNVDRSWVLLTIPASTATGVMRAFLRSLLQQILAANDTGIGRVAIATDDPDVLRVNSRMCRDWLANIDALLGA